MFTAASADAGKSGATRRYLARAQTPAVDGRTGWASAERARHRRRLYRRRWSRSRTRSTSLTKPQGMSLRGPAIKTTRHQKSRTGDLENETR